MTTTNFTALSTEVVKGHAGRVIPHSWFAFCMISTIGVTSLFFLLKADLKRLWNGVGKRKNYEDEDSVCHSAGCPVPSTIDDAVRALQSLANANNALKLELNNERKKSQRYRESLTESEYNAGVYLFENNLLKHETKYINDVEQFIGSVAEINRNLNDQLDNERTTIEQMQKVIDDLIDQKNTLEKEVQTQKERSEDFFQRMTNAEVFLEDVEREAHDLKDNITDLVAQNTFLSAEYERLKDAEKKYQHINLMEIHNMRLAAENKSIKKDYDKIKSQLENVESFLDDNMEDKVKEKAILSEFEKKVIEILEENIRSKDVNSALQEELYIVKKALQELSEVKMKLEARVEKAMKENDSHIDSLAAAKDEIVAIRNQKGRLEKEIDHYQEAKLEAIKQYDEILNQNRMANATITMLKDKVEYYEKKQLYAKLKNVEAKCIKEVEEKVRETIEILEL